MFTKINYPLFGLLILAVVVLTIGINKPFVGIHDFNGVQIGNAAKNYQDYGVLNLKFGQVISKIPGDYTKVGSFYTSYLPALPLTVYILFIFLGVHEWSERLVPILFSLVGLIFFYLIIQKIWKNSVLAFLASLIYLLTPMFIYFGKMPTFDPVILAWCLISYYFFIRWLENFQTKYLTFFTMVIFIGGLYGWIIGYIIPAVFIQSFLLKRFRRELFVPAVSYFLTVGLQIFHGWILSPNFQNISMFRSLQTRLFETDLSFGGQDFTFFNYIRHESSILWSFFGKIIIGFSLLGLIVTWLKRNRTFFKFNLQNTTLLVWLLIGLGHPIIFSKAVFIHEYQNIYLLPVISASAALGINSLVEYLKLKMTAKYLMVCAVLVLSFYDRLNFIQALQNSEMNRPALEVAGILNQVQTGHNQTVILSPRFGSFFGIFTDFYSNYAYKVSDEQTFKKLDYSHHFKYVLTFDQDITDFNLYQSLIDHYKYEKIGQETLIYLDEPRQS